MKNLFKKLLVACGIIIATSVTINIYSPKSASAYGSDCRPFLGMVSWDCNVEENITNEDQLKTNTWTIVANVATDITVIAAYLVLGYVIYGGYLYVFSGGEPSKVATGKKALYQAFLGLAIVMSANIILNFIRVALGGDFTKNCTEAGECYGVGDAGNMIISTLQWAIGVAGVVAAIFVVYGGISYVTSAGDPSKLQKAKNMITYALIGLAIVGAAEAITAFVSSMIREANKTSLIENIKEYHEPKKIG